MAGIDRVLFAGVVILGVLFYAVTLQNPGDQGTLESKSAAMTGSFGNIPNPFNLFSMILNPGEIVSRELLPAALFTLFVGVLGLVGVAGLLDYARSLRSA